jgi:DNA-binding CsgD family transcriptional regulator
VFIATSVPFGESVLAISGGALHSEQTITVDRELVLFGIASGIVSVWVIITFGLGASSIFIANPFDVADSSPWAPFLTADVICLLVAYALRWRLGSVEAYAPAALVVVVVASAGSFLMLMGSIAAVLVGAACAAVSQTLVFALVACIYSRFSAERAEQAVLASLVVGVVAIVALLWIPDIVRFSIAQVLPIISFILLRRISKLQAEKESASDAEKGTTASRSGGTSPVPVSPAARRRAFKSVATNAGLILLGIGTPAAFIFFLLPLVTQGSEGALFLISTVPLGVGYLLALLGSVLYFRFSRSVDVRTVFFCMAPVAVFAALLLLITPAWSLPSMLLIAIIVWFPQLEMVCLSKISREAAMETFFQGRMDALYIGGHALCQACVLVGVMVGSAVAPVVMADGHMQSVAIYAGTFALSIVASVIVFVGGPMAEKGQGASAESADERELIARMAKEYGLSPRETEVFGFLVKGRSNPYIRDQLCISSNTVNSHVRRIYAKTGAHDKQSLIDLFESER